ncbi:MAG: efflux RND transporter permease subunit [bacterium]|nr:efflux RND transporter permease subunit [bacterium]
MKAAIKFCIQHPTLVNLGIVLILGIGFIKLSNTQNTNFPKKKIRFIDVIIPYPGASPSEVEQGITIKVEDNLDGIEGIDRVISSSNENKASIEVELEESADASILLLEVKNAVDKINNFPSGVEPAIVAKREPKDITISMGLVGNLPLTTMKDYAEDIKDELLLFQGLSQAFVRGAPEEEIEISVRENDLRAFGLSLMQVKEAIENSNLETFGGNIETKTEKINIKAENEGKYGLDLAHIAIHASEDGEIIYLKDVADITNKFKDSPEARYLQGNQIIVIETYTLNSEDILRNATNVKSYIQKFNNDHDGIELKILEDGTVNLDNRISTMLNNGVIGVILVLVVLSLFLDRYLATWVSLKIPVAMIGMFCLIDIYDASINVVSLFGFILVLGILVDDGVVIGENIYQHAKKKGKSPMRAALDGTVEMITPVIISLTTTAVAFSLFLFLPTQAGEFFGEIAFIVIAVLFVALIESFFVLPVHLAYSKGLEKSTKLTKLEIWFTNSLDWVKNKVYLPVLNKAIFRGSWMKILTVFGFVVLLVCSIASVRFGFINFTFFPNLDDDAIFIEMELPPGTSVEVTQEKLELIERAIWKVNNDYSRVRKDGNQIVQFVEQITGPLDNQGKLKITFLSGEQRGVSSFELANKIRHESPQIPEATRLIYGLGATSAVFGLPISFALKSKNLDELRSAKHDLKVGMNALPDLIKDVSDNDMEGIQEYKIKLKPKAELLGLNLVQVMSQVRAGFFGIKVQSIQRGSEEVEIWVRYPLDGRRSKNQLLDMRIRTIDQGEYPLHEIAIIEEGFGNLTINHLEGRREIRIEANVANVYVSAPKAIAKIEQELLPEILNKYPSVTYTIEGQNRMSFKLLEAISFIGPIILVFILALIIINCNSFSQGILIFSLFPFAIIGVIFGHWVHNTSLSIFSLIGTIALIGVFVNNALVFISTLNDLLKEGKGFLASLSETASSRFRPILLTSVTTIAGLAPLITSSSLSAQFLKGPAIAIAYGLGFGIFNVLILLPMILIAFNSLRRLWYNSIRGKALSTEEVEPAVRKLKFLIKD